MGGMPETLPRLAAARAWLGACHLTPDGLYYLAAARGEPVPRPYAYRWLLPTLLGPEPWRWALCSYLSILALGPIAWGYFGAVGLEGWPRAWAVAALLLLQGVTRTSVRYPVLLDAPSFALALATAWAARAGSPAALPVAVLLALAAGATKEPAPLFAALWSWSPVPLVGMLATGWWVRHVDPAVAAPEGYRVPPVEPLPAWLTHPVREAVALRRRVGLDFTLYVRPWGPAIAGLGAPTWQLALTLAVAYGQLIAAQDSIRLYQWAAPVLVAQAAVALRLETWPALGLVVLVGAITRDDRV